MGKLAGGGFFNGGWAAASGRLVAKCPDCSAGVANFLCFLRDTRKMDYRCLEGFGYEACRVSLDPDRRRYVEVTLHECRAKITFWWKRQLVADLRIDCDHEDRP